MTRVSAELGEGLLHLGDGAGAIEEVVREMSAAVLPVPVGISRARFSSPLYACVLLRVDRRVAKARRQRIQIELHRGRDGDEGRRGVGSRRRRE